MERYMMVDGWTDNWMDGWKKINIRIIQIDDREMDSCDID